MSEELDKAIEALRKPWLISENRESVVVYKDDLTLVLDRLEELEDMVSVSLDVSSELKVGDEVSTMIDYMEARRGMIGKVVSLKENAEYPIEVEFKGVRFLYLKNGVVGFKRNELAKVRT